MQHHKGKEVEEETMVMDTATKGRGSQDQIQGHENDRQQTNDKQGNQRGRSRYEFRKERKGGIEATKISGSSRLTIVSEEKGIQQIVQGTSPRHITRN
eukprot:15347861-Ditylum_brightwellii.AAC.2